MQLICPCCHTRYPLDAANQDEAARELLALRGSIAPRCWNPLIAYLGLFRSETRALAWDRAHRLAREVMELNADPDRLENALAETVEALRLKGGPPLKNHNYLKRVLENCQGNQVVQRRETAKAEPTQSKRAAAIAALSEWAGEDWLRQEISIGLKALVVQSLKNQPAAELITMNADVWHVALRTSSKSLTIEEVDAPRIRVAFSKIFSTVTEWPAPKLLLDQLPTRPYRQSLPEPEETEEQRERGRAAARALTESICK
jgi:hypothetical protein